MGPACVVHGSVVVHCRPTTQQQLLQAVPAGRPWSYKAIQWANFSLSNLYHRSPALCAGCELVHRGKTLLNRPACGRQYTSPALCDESYPCSRRQGHRQAGVMMRGLVRRSYSEPTQRSASAGNPERRISFLEEGRGTAHMGHCGTCRRHVHPCSQMESHHVLPARMGSGST